VGPKRGQGQSRFRAELALILELKMKYFLMLVLILILMIVAVFAIAATTYADPEIAKGIHPAIAVIGSSIVSVVGFYLSSLIED
jgi:hypothetical protein